MPANSDYLRVLADVARCITAAMHDERIPDLTAEQIVYWLHSVTVEDLQIAMEMAPKQKPTKHT